MNVHLHHFAIISGTGWLIDLSIFGILTANDWPYYAANWLGASVAVSFIYFVSTRIIFRQSRNGPFKATVEYAAWNFVAISLASTAVQGLGTLLLTPTPSGLLDALTRLVAIDVPIEFVTGVIAKLIITPLTMYANYIAIGLIVERRLRFI